MASLLEEDKHTERERYERRAASVLARHEIDALGPDGAEGVAPELRRPYFVYESYIRQFARAGMRVLDVCCGNGQHSFTAARLGATVIVSDIASRNVEVTQIRARRLGLDVDGVVADSESLPWPDASFDIVTCAGSLSYVQLERFLAEVKRVLRPKGAFVCVDSLNHNPLYRLNRWIHYRRGERSRSVNARIPTLATVERLFADFPDRAEASFYGIFSFLAPTFRFVCGAERAVRILDGLDDLCPFLKRYSFKFVFRGALPDRDPEFRISASV